MVKYGFSMFKAFKKFPIIAIKPVTALCGINSCGKSSFLQSILLQTQSIRMYSFRSPIALLLKGDLVQLGEWKDLCFRDSIQRNIEDKIISFAYVFDHKNLKDSLFMDEFYSILGYLRLKHRREESDQEIFKKMIDELTEYQEADNFQWKMKIGFQQFKNEDFPTFTLLNFNSLREGKLIRDWKLIKKKAEPHFSLEINKAGPNAFGLEDEIVIDVVIRERQPYVRDTGRWIFPRMARASTMSRLRDLDFSQFCPEYSIASSFVLSLLKNIRFLGPLREPPRRMYQFNRLSDLDIGIKGEFSLQVLSSEAEKELDLITLPPESKKNQRIAITLLECLNEWLKFLELPRAVSERVEVPYLTIYTWKLEEDKFTGLLPDVGFGVSQILPVLIEALRMSPGEILILEQPEIHLHPRLQARLADFILTLAKTGRYFIIETHSEHFINRLCLRSAEGKDKEVSNLINILFVTNGKDDSGAKIQPVTINQYGEPESWPKGFFDETDAGAILEAGIKKRRKIVDR